MGTMRMATLNLCIEVKKILETVLNRNDITILLESDDKYVVFEGEYIQDINYKIPAVSIDIIDYSFEPLELGGEDKVLCTALINVSAISSAEALDIAETLVDNLVGVHNFYDFSTLGNIPDLSVPYDQITLPNTVMTMWEVENKQDIKIELFKDTARYETNYVLLHTAIITVDFKYIKP